MKCSCNNLNDECYDEHECPKCHHMWCSYCGDVLIE